MKGRLKYNKEFFDHFLQGSSMKLLLKINIYANLNTYSDHTKKCFILRMDEQHLEEIMIIETQRLILRPLNLDDAQEAYDGWTGDAEANKWVSWLPHESIDSVVDWLKEISWDQNVTEGFPRDNYIWGFVLKETGKLFGSGGLIWEDAYQLYQVGYNINKSYWNKGYTTEAMRAILDFSIKNLGLKRVAGGHAKENLASAKVLEKLGFVYDRDDITHHVDGIRQFESREYYLDLKIVKVGY